ncbi:hypothetical protein BLA60_17080 [Actinophytocola xinjiangensis]|uniref:Uncharacterized protein n=2 Tax=Actinophytocola xinjiangensis TaxID=485602 RepID=A0A7Z1AZ50_9PSEU|nr:hypothetical protein BLA60_17080 [Actinophytocola xinjiangensis]
MIAAFVGVVVVAAVTVVLVLTLGGDDDDSTADGGGGGGDTTSEGSDLPNGLPGPNGGGSGGSGDSGGGSGSSGGSGGDASPDQLAELVVEVIETRDEDIIDEHACSPGDADRMKSDLAQLQGMDASASVDDVQEAGDVARAMIELSMSGEGTATIVAEMENDDGWCVSAIRIRS